MIWANNATRTATVCGIFAAVFALTLLPLSSPGFASSGVEGVWYDDTGQGAVEIRRCGDRLCGHIVWLKDPIDKDGRPLIDDLNPEARNRNRPICGLKVIGQLERQRDGSWDGGWIYDPKQGKSFDVMLTLKAPSQLVVTGYLGVKFLSESFVWRRAPQGLPRCATASL